MSTKFSFTAADELIWNIKRADESLVQKNQELYERFAGLKAFFGDERYDEYHRDILRANEACNRISCSVNDIINSLEAYKERLYAHYVGEFAAKVAFAIVIGSQIIKTAGEKKKRQERYEVLQQNITDILLNPDIPFQAKRIYMMVGSKAIVAEDMYEGTPHFDIGSNTISFHLPTDLNNPCGNLSTYFHEIGHMIDHNSCQGSILSNDEAFKKALAFDCEQYIKKVMDDHGCSKDLAYDFIRRELMVNNNLYSDVSDIMGSLTNCHCQNLWGHSRSYWLGDPSRVQREAFANMFSTSMQGKRKIEVMKCYFPTAYKRFETLIEVARNV